MPTLNEILDQHVAEAASDLYEKLDRITHHVHILEMNGDSFRLKQSRRKRTQP